MLTWNEFDIEVQEMVCELKSSGDFTCVKSSLPWTHPLTGRLTTNLYLSIASGRVFQVVLVEGGDEPEISNICIEEKPDNAPDMIPVETIGTKGEVLIPAADPQTVVRYFFDLENLYRCLFRQAVGVGE